MTTPYTPTASHHSTITTITDNDKPSGSLFSTPLEELADNVAYAREEAATLVAAEAATRGGKDTIHEQAVTAYGSGGDTHAAGTKMPLVSALPVGHPYTVSGNEITVPAVGVYDISYRASFKSSNTTNPLPINVVCSDPVGILQDAITRWSATAGDYVTVSGRVILAISNTATQKISVTISSTPNTGTITHVISSITVRRIS